MSAAGWKGSCRPVLSVTPHRPYGSECITRANFLAGPVWSAEVVDRNLDNLVPRTNAFGRQLRVYIKPIIVDADVAEGTDAEHFVAGFEVTQMRSIQQIEKSGQDAIAGVVRGEHS
jgi:hypothetical protein